jgi:hypothetical protein
MRSVDGYILVGNFGLDFDGLKGQFLDASTDLKFREFFTKIESVAKILDIKILDFFDNMVVLKASREDAVYLEKYLGDKFSFAVVDRQGIEQVYDTCDRQSTGEPGCSAFKGRASESAIRIRLSGCRYDA